MRCRLSEIMEIIGGGTPKTSKADYWNGNIPWVSVKDFANDYKYVYRTEKCITELGLKNSSTKLLQVDDVIISARGTVGQVAMIPFPMAFNQSCYGLRAKKEFIIEDYLYYLIRNSVRILKKNTHGSVFETITRDTFDRIEVDIPNLNVQRKISHLLSDLDKNIEFNEKINNNLSDILQTIYQQNFNSSEQVNSQRSVLSNICSYSTEKISVASLNLSNYYSTENMLPEKAGAVDASSLPAMTQTTKCKVGDVLISNIRPYFKKIVYCQSECGCSTDVLCFTPKKPELSAYVYSTLYADGFFNYMVAGSKGTKMPRGDKQQIMSYPVYVPTDIELEAFNQLAKPVLFQIERNRLENIKLVTLRNSLLPKLISGELDVSDIQF